jgi:hypothetical protein
MTSTLSHLPSPLVSAHKYAYHRRQVSSLENCLWSRIRQDRYTADSAGRSSTRAKNAGRSEGSQRGDSNDISYSSRHHDTISIASRSEPRAHRRVASVDANALSTPLSIANHDGVTSEIEPITDFIGPSYTHVA